HRAFWLLRQTELGNDKADDNFARFNPPVAKAIQQYYPGDFPRYEKARQQTGDLNMSIFNTIHLGWTWLSYGFLILAAVLAFIRNRYDLLCVAIVVSFALVLNAVIHGMLVGVGIRYQVKMTWIATLAAFAVLAALHNNKKQRHFPLEKKQ